MVWLSESALKNGSGFVLVGWVCGVWWKEEMEAALAEIDYYCKKLLMKLKEYKGEDLEVIHEAVALVCESVKENKYFDKAEGVQIF
ncbi:hypothetical protein U1Q18_037568 [Sarracenia purpurea var. burkii]